MVSPVDGSVFAEIALATDREVDAVLSRAARVQRTWAGTPLAERVAICERMVRWMLDRADDDRNGVNVADGRPVAHTPE